MSDVISGELPQDLKNSWGTDKRLFNKLDAEFHFDIDLAASEKNALCDRFYTSNFSALEQPWDLTGKVTCWCNPPYGRGFIKQFMQKAAKERLKGVTTVMLVPATLDAKWLPFSEISEIRIITGGRLSFVHPITGKMVAGNTKGSMLVIFRPTNMPLSIRLVDRNELLSC